MTRAVIVAGADATQNTTAPANGAPWDHVGTVGSASGVYLGSFATGYWVLTAAHVGAGNFSVGGSTYSFVGGSAVQVRNGDNSTADLTLFRIATDPGLTNLTLSSATPAINSSVTMIGNGSNWDTAGTLFYVNTTTNPWTWSTSDFSGRNATVGGYFWTSGSAMRWGNNTIDGTSSYNIGTGNTTALVVDFDAVAGQTQGAVGDSGGAMFYLNGSTWELTGILGAIGGFSGQPGSTAVFGNVTYAPSIAAYNGFITSTIPEPADVALWSGLVLGAVAIWKRRRDRR